MRTCHELGICHQRADCPSHAACTDSEPGQAFIHVEDTHTVLAKMVIAVGFFSLGLISGLLLLAGH